jgi:GNAT superfamily N-acetyltransferase
MSRKIVSLNLDNLGDLPSPCRSCVLWELGPRPAEPAGKADWVRAVLLEWGSCGQVAYVDGQAAGFVLYAPAEYVDGPSVVATSSTSDDAVLLMTARVLPEYAGAGLGSVLVQSMVKDLMRRRKVKAIEAFGDAQGLELRCLVPAGFLTAVGFKTVQPHPRFPRLRLDLRNVVTWRTDVELALERWLGAIRPSVVRPEPSGGPVGVSPRAEPHRD